MVSSKGLRCPAEWEPQAGVMLTWPHSGTDWSDRLTQVYPVFAEIGAAIARHEMLVSVCRSKAHAEEIRHYLMNHGVAAERLLFSIADSNDSWARDHGALTSLDDDKAILHSFVFNGWGDKFAAQFDAAISNRMREQRVFADTEMRSHAMVLEGGAIESDGAGTLLATRSSVIAESRNPGMGQAEIEHVLSNLFGFERFLWLEHGDISGDDTDGHIDTLARFADPETILYSSAPPGDDDHPGLAAMEAQLRSFRDAHGRSYRLQPLPFPGVHLDEDQRRLPATYANFLIINDAVLLPVYGVAQDHEAIAIVQAAFPDREVVPIDCREIIVQNGSLHCLTMQFPAQVELRDTLEFAIA